MPPDLEGEIAAGAAAMGLSPTAQQRQQLAAFVRLLKRWNTVHNLTAIRRDSELLSHHLLDSLSLLPQFRRVAGAGAARVLDVGSGGGLPGMVLAIAEPQARFTLIDAVQKKCAFLLQARVELGLANVEVVHSRVESWRAPPFDLIVSRALTTLAQFVAWTDHLLAAQGQWMAMKGRLPKQEIAGLPSSVQVVATVPLTVPGLGEARHLIEMRRA